MHKIATRNLPRTAAASVLINSTDGQTAQISLPDLRAQLGVAPVSQFQTWTTDLLSYGGSSNGEQAEVSPSDDGQHNGATATGYDGDLVDNAGLYSWVEEWSRWSKTSADTPVVGKGVSGAAQRPGDAPDAFCSATAGQPDAVEGVQDIATVSASDGNGNVLLLSGSKTIAPRVAASLQTGRTFRFEGRYLRLNDTSDPAGDTVELGIAALDGSYKVIETIVIDQRAPSKVDGGQCIYATFGVSGALVSPDHEMSSSAVYARPYLRTYGSDHSTAVIELGFSDITEVSQIEGSLDVATIANAVNGVSDKLTEASGYSSSAGMSAAQAALYEGPWVDDYEALLVDTSLTYLEGTASSVEVGGYVRTRKEAYSYKVADSGADDYQVETFGGVKLYIETTGGRYPAEAFGFNETNTGTKNAENLRTALNLGPVSIGKGTFELSAMTHLSGDDLWGSGRETILTNSLGHPIMLFGSLKGNSFVDGVSARLGIDAVSLGDRVITLSALANISKFAVGDVIAIASESGYEDGDDHFKPAYQQITEVIDLDEGLGTITIKEPAYRSAPETGDMFVMHSDDMVSDGHAVWGVANNGLTKNLTIGNFQVVGTDTDSWMRIGGTYRSKLGPFWVDKSHGAVVMNGLAYSTIHVVNATISRHLIDLAFFSHNSTVTVDTFSGDDSLDNEEFNLIGLAEGAHDNTIYVGNGFAPGEGKRSAVIKLGDGTAGNKINVNNVGVERCASLIKQERVADSPMATPSTVINSGRLYATQSDYGVNLDSNTAGDDALVRIERGVTLDLGGSSEAVQVSVSVSGSYVGCEIIGGAGGISVAGDVRGGRIETLHEDMPTITNLSPLAAVSLGVGVIGRPVGDLSASICRGGEISALSVENRYERFIQPGSVFRGDTIEFKVFGASEGLNGKKFVRIKLGVETVDYEIASDEVGAFVVDGILTVMDDWTQRMFLRIADNTGLSVVRRSFSSDFEVDTVTFSIGGLVEDAADLIYPEAVVVKHRRQGRNA